MKLQQMPFCRHWDRGAYYAARILDNVTIAPSPQWLQKPSHERRICPINNVVGTNYILLYFGQPMHAFDLDTFEGARFACVKRVAGEKLVTLMVKNVIWNKWLSHLSQTSQ